MYMCIAAAIGALDCSLTLSLLACKQYSLSYISMSVFYIFFLLIFLFVRIAPCALHTIYSNKILITTASIYCMAKQIRALVSMVPCAFYYYFEIFLKNCYFFL